jgi:hypothetical protein
MLPFILNCRHVNCPISLLNPPCARHFRTLCMRYLTRRSAAFALIPITTGLALQRAAWTHESGVTPARERTIPRDERPAIFDSTTWIEMRNVDLRALPNATIKVERLRGQVMRTGSGVPFLDDTKSFSIRITSGRVALEGADLTVLLNTFVFNDPDVPLKKLKVTIKGSELIQTGVMHKGVDLPFEMIATASVTPEGLVRIRPKKVKMLGIDGQKLLHALGLKLDKILDLKKAHGATVKGDDLYLDPTVLTPPPAFSGKIIAIRIENGLMVQEFATLPDDSIFGTYVRPDSTVPNLVHFRGGVIRFGRLQMHDTDLTIVDADPSNPLDLYLAQYAKQLVAGTSRTLPNLGLRVEFPDYGKLSSARASPVASPRSE